MTSAELKAVCFIRSARERPTRQYEQNGILVRLTKKKVAAFYSSQTGRRISFSAAVDIIEKGENK